MLVKLIALVAIAAGVFDPAQSAIAEGESFELAPALAEKAIADGLAKADESSQAPKNAMPPKADKPAKAVKVRVLVDCVHGRANDVAELPATAVKGQEAEGLVDSSAAAVTYALTLPQNRSKG